MLALTLHVIVQMAALQVGVANFKDYSIIGDDNTILDNKVTMAYKELIESSGMVVPEGNTRGGDI
jgi:hypothetical protein